MNLGGIKVGTLELEQLLDAHEAVYESAAVAVQPEGEGAEKLVVYAVLERDIGKDRLAAELGRMIAGGLNPLFKLHDLVITDRLPRTASNKLMRRELRAAYAARAPGSRGSAKTGAGRDGGGRERDLHRDQRSHPARSGARFPGQ
jgi:acetyl-CoA synthetase